jgi:hypothetical protein
MNFGTKRCDFQGRVADWRLEGVTRDRFWTGALRALRPRWLIRPAPRRTSSHLGLKEARI